MAEWNHKSVWGAIDALAARHGLSPSALARKAGLDATAFNPSKRHGPDPDNRPRWPSTESIAKVLAATGETLDTFRRAGAAPREELLACARDVCPRAQGRRAPSARAFVRCRLLGLAEAGAGGFFDDGGFPAGQGWDQITIPGLADDSAYALQVSGDSMLPLYRNGDIIIVSPAARIRRGDRVVVKTASGEVMAKILKRQSSAELELGSFNPEHPSRSVSVHEVAWMARILWASQ